MNDYEFVSVAGSWIVEAPWWATSMLKITVVLVVAWLMHAMLTQANPRWRVMLWRAAAVGLVAVVAIDALGAKSLAIPVAKCRIYVKRADSDSAWPAHFA